MDEIKSSFQPIDKLIQSFNEPIYVISVNRTDYTRKNLYVNFEVYLCSNLKSVRNKLFEIVNDKLKKDSTYINLIYKEPTEDHKLFKYINFVMEGNEMEENEYVFSGIKEDCPQDILLQIAKEFILWYEIKIDKKELLIE